MHLQMEHGKKLLTVEHRLKRSREIIEEKDEQIARLTAASSTDTSIAMAMNVKTEVNKIARCRYKVPRVVSTRMLWRGTYCSVLRISGSRRTFPYECLFALLSIIILQLTPPVIGGFDRNYRTRAHATGKITFERLRARRVCLLRFLWFDDTYNIVNRIV